MAGVRRLGKTGELHEASLPGYSPTSYSVDRMGKLTAIVLRYWIHSVMRLSAELAAAGLGGAAALSVRGRSNVAQLMYPNSSVSSLPSAGVWVEGTHWSISQILLINV